MVQIEIEGFSGPLDLLCHMIDNGEIEASKISVSDVVSLYAQYLMEHGELPIAQVADFIAQAAHLLKQKASALMPKPVEVTQEYEQEDYDDCDVDDLLKVYRPYREAAEKLTGLKDIADKRRFRKDTSLEPMFDLGDLYSLALQWQGLLERHRRDIGVGFSDPIEYIEGLDGGLPAQIPDEVQVEKRMERVMECMEAFPEGVSMRYLLEREKGVGALVVTLLALLELSRRNKLTLIQKELFADVLITYRAG